ncbi:MAG TPA: HAD-IA family hydrolase [Solirubrobacteraceae bacterium]|nr:HAD-IA family hydrolase [Solirubrobacteraceae bacterium]
MGRRTLLLDAMGTLVALQTPAARLRSVLRDRLGVSVTEAEARAALGAEIAHYRAHMGGARDAATLSDLRAHCAQVLFDALPSRAVLAAADADTRTDVLLSALRFTAFPDAVRLLERARRAGTRAVVVSNWDVSLPEVLERAGLAPLLDGVVASAPVGAAKPSPAIFARALELAGTAAEDCVHVGDSLAEDVAGARAAGIEAVLLDRSGETVPDAGVRVITSLDELSPSGSRSD